MSPIDPDLSSSDAPSLRLKAERIQSALRDLPGWGLSSDLRWLERRHELTSVQAAVTGLCHAATSILDLGGHVRLEIDGSNLTLRLGTPTAGGVTEADLTRARAIDAR